MEKQGKRVRKEKDDIIKIENVRYLKIIFSYYIIKVGVLHSSYVYFTLPCNSTYNHTMN